MKIRSGGLVGYNEALTPPRSWVRLPPRLYARTNPFSSGLTPVYTNYGQSCKGSVLCIDLHRPKTFLQVFARSSIRYKGHMYLYMCARYDALVKFF